MYYTALIQLLSWNAVALFSVGEGAPLVAASSRSSLAKPNEGNTHTMSLGESQFNYGNKISHPDEEITPFQVQEFFEGDLKIPYDLYRQYYEPQLESGGYRSSDQKKGGVVRDTSLLWPSGVIYYQYDSSVDQYTKNLIQQSMNYIAETTCLRFIKSISDTPRIIFQTDNQGCYSTSVGRVKTTALLQYINLNLANGCVTRPVIIHEICHAIGFWHEHTRPDRDQYIEIVWDNVKPGIEIEYQFQKRTIDQVDIEVSEYDFDSVMHYDTEVFNRQDCSGRNCETIRIKNEEAYKRQGSPRLGPKNELSVGDIQEIKRMYSCTGKGITGQLTVSIRNGVGLPDTDRIAGAPEPYVKVTALNNKGSSVLTTNVKSGIDVTWEQELNFGIGDWFFFKIQVWDEDFGSDDEMTQSETVFVKKGSHLSMKHCQAPDVCNTGYIIFDYTLQIEKANTECMNNPCQNGGTCIDSVASYTCACTEGYEGDKCQYARGNLRFYARYGKNLHDSDRWLLAGTSDPYIEVVGYDHLSTSTRKNTKAKSNTNDPVWNEILEFGIGSWQKIQVRVLDEDVVKSDEVLCDWSTYELVKGVSEVKKQMKCKNDGFVEFDYSFANGE